MPVAAVNGTGSAPGGGGGGEMVRNFWASYVYIACGLGDWDCWMRCLSVVTGPDKHGPPGKRRKNLFPPSWPLHRCPQA